MTNELFKNFWYLYLIIAVAMVYGIFKTKIKGFTGEKSVAVLISTLDKSKYKVINNIMLKMGDRTSQIDHVVVSNYGIFVIETKNYKGWIAGSEKDEYWRHKPKNIPNPIRQNYGHVQALKYVLGEYKELNFIPIVVFTTNADLKVSTVSDVIYTPRLIRTIKKYSNVTLSDTAKEQIYKKLISLNVDSTENRREHTKTIQRNIEIKDNKIKNNICPKCGGNLVVRNSQYGKFLGCSNYPRCRFKKS